MSPAVIGITGGIGSGKTAVSNAFAAQGLSIVDADVIAHQVTAAGGSAIEAIAERFGAAFITPERALDRAAMRQLVFAEPAARLQLEAIVHPLIRNQTLAQLHASHSDYTVLVVPLMVESGKWLKVCRRLLVVDCVETTQVARVQERSGLDESTVRSIMRNQATRQQRLAAADDVIFNENKSLEAITAEVALLHARYLGKLHKVS
jgi:dephospho-CoA kinase